MGGAFNCPTLLLCNNWTKNCGKVGDSDDRAFVVTYLSLPKYTTHGVRISY